MSNASPSPGDRIHVTVDPSRCVGAGQCVRTDPTIFDQSEEGTVRLLRDDLPIDLAETLAEAASLCPGKAIMVRR